MNGPAPGPVDDFRNLAWGLRRWAELSQATADMTAAEVARTKARRTLAERQRQLADVVAQLQLDLSEATGIDGKRAYPNPESRAAALRRGLAEDRAAVNLQAAIDQAEREAVEADIDFETARRTRQNTLAILAFAASWLESQTVHFTDHREEKTRP